MDRHSLAEVLGPSALMDNILQIWLAALLLLGPILATLADRTTKHTKWRGAPVVGRKWSLEPLFVTRYRFVLNGWAVTREGWQKASSKNQDTVFTIVRPDSNITVLPPRYIDELQNVHSARLHPMEALSADMLGTYSGQEILTNSHLSFDAVRNKLTPRIGQTLPALLEEVEYALPKVLPPCREWTPVDANDTMTRIISHLTSLTWVGRDLAHNEAWHSLNMETVAAIFTISISLKLLPGFMQPIVGPILLIRWKLRKYIKQIHSHLIPLIEERRRRWPAVEGQHEYSDDRPQDVMQWMMDAAEGEESDPANLATRYVYAVIGSLFTVSGGIVDCLYDLAAYPAHVQPLRDELQRVLKEDGGWKKGTPAKLERMDSFMKESQRINNPTPLSLKRIAKENIILSDGLTIPKGSYICIVNSASIGREDEPFDGFRYAQKTQSGSVPSSKARQTWYTSPDHSHNTFGLGRYACPGRFVAAVEIKLVLAALLMKYDVAFTAEGETGPEKRPKPIHLLELSLPDPRARLYLRKREVAEQ